MPVPTAAGKAVEADQPGQILLVFTRNAIEQLHPINPAKMAANQPGLSCFGQTVQELSLFISDASCDAFNIPRKILISF